MEVCESSGEQPQLLHWDRKLSELCEPADPDTLLCHTHFTEFLDEFSPDVLGQLLNDPFLSEKNEIMEVELSPASPAPLIQAEHSYSLCGDSRPQSPLTHISTDDNFNEVDPLHLPPTPPSSHGSDSEGGQSPARSLPPSSPIQLQATAKVTSRTASALSNSPLLTAPHKLQGTGPLILTEEEKRTLIAEGYPIPTKLPLTKAEEKVLKKIRRKIKNKISAQESRRKKKEYMDSLEKKVETCSNENSELRKKVEVLENTNRTLLQQLQRLQAMVAGKVSRSCKAASTQTGTCLMMVVLCFAVVFGSFSQSYGPYPSATKMVLPRQHSSPESYTDSIVRSRSLLIYEEPHQLEESSSPISFADRNDRQADTSKYTALSLEAMQGTQQDDIMQFTIANETRLEKSVLLGLQQHRVNSELEGNETLKIIEIDRRVNATA
ncbi:cyclic AMP-responsive element-binding protein 3-like protein 2 isoform 4-T4 [Amazona ochrocephala]